MASREQQRRDVVGEQQADRQDGAGQRHIGHQRDADRAVLLNQRVYAAKAHAAGNQREQAGDLDQDVGLAGRIGVEVAGAGDRERPGESADVDVENAVVNENRVEPSRY